MDGATVKAELKRLGRTQADLARFMGIDSDKISKSLSGLRSIKADEAEKIRQFLQMPDREVDNQAPAPDRVGVMVSEVDLTAGAGSGVHAFSDQDIGHTDIDLVATTNSWVIPQELIDSLPTVGPKKICIFRVVGKSMEPEFRPGERVIVNVLDRTPSPPGHFVVWDGFSLVIKFVEPVPHSDPRRIILRSHHPMVDPYERLEGEAFIQGRVVSHLEFT